MTTLNKEILKTVKKMASEGAAIKKIRAYLTLEDVSDKDASLYIDELGLKGSKRGFAAEFYDWLAEGQRTNFEINEYILNPENSQNVHKHLSHYKNIADLANRIWASKA